MKSDAEIQDEASLEDIQRRHRVWAATTAEEERAAEMRRAFAREIFENMTPEQKKEARERYLHRQDVAATVRLADELSAWMTARFHKLDSSESSNIRYVCGALRHYAEEETE